MAGNSEKLKNYEATIRRRVDCEEKAFHIVNKLIDGTVDGPYLIQCGQMISREHYHDVVEERAISHLCGYPLCDKTLVDIPKKQYHISTRANKVYDITERKNFCSNQCLRASKHFSNQISESPLWVRFREPAASIKLMPHTGIRGMVGDEVVGLSPKKLLDEEIKNLEELDIGSSDSGRKSKLPQTSEKKTNQTCKGLRKVTSKVTVPEENVKQLQTTEEEEKEVSVDVNITECGTDPFHCGTDNPLDRKHSKKEETSENGTILEVLNKNNLLSVNTSSRSDESSSDHKKEDHLSNIIVNRNDYSEMKSGANIAKSPHDKSETEVRESDNMKDQTMKIDHLMKLLSKRKAVLSGMIDFVTAESVPNSNTADRVALSSVESTLPVKGSNKQGQSSPNQNTLVSGQGKMSASKPKTVPKSPLEHIGAILKTWVTDETTAYIQSSSLAGSSEGSMSFSDPRVQRGYADLCQRLDAQQKDFEDLVSETPASDLSSDDRTRALKSTPDYGALKKEAEALQLKVTEFITGRRPELVYKKAEKDEEKEAVYIPTVDAYDQQQIRIKIVLDRLDKFLPDLLAPLCLSVQDVSSLVRELVYTFRLKKDNIVFRPSEWILVAIFILKILGRKSTTIAGAFSAESAVRHFTILLTGIGNTVADLDMLTDNILSS